MAILKEFKQFAMRGNVVDLAVGVIIGAAFGSVVSSLVKDVIMPPIGFVLGKMDFQNLAFTLHQATMPDGKDAVVIRYGAFLNSVIGFVIQAFCVFLIVKGMNALQRKEEAKPAPAPGPTTDQKLLTEIRDLLKAKF